MFDRLRLAALIAPLVLLAAPAVGQTPAAPAAPAAAPKPSSKALAGKPNPAVANCAKRGGVSEITVNKRGNEYGWCKLPDGKVCEEWALLQDKVCIEKKG